MNTQSSALSSDDRLMTDKEACDYLRIKARQLYNWRLDGIIPYIRVGRSLRYRKSTIDAALATRTFGPGGN